MIFAELEDITVPTIRPYFSKEVAYPREINTTLFLTDRRETMRILIVAPECIPVPGSGSVEICILAIARQPATNHRLA